MPDVEAPTLIDRNYIFGPVEVNGTSYGYYPGFGWVDAGILRYTEPPLHIKRKLNSENWAEVGRYEAGSEVPLVKLHRNATATYGWSEGNWILALPNIPVSLAPDDVAQKLYDLYGHRVEKLLFYPERIHRKHGIYGKNRYNGRWHNVDTFGLVQSGHSIKSLEKDRDEMINISSQTSAMSFIKKKRGRKSSMPFFIILD